MSFGNLDPQGMDAHLARRIATPAAPKEQSFSAWSFAQSGAAGIPQGGLEVLGTLRDFSRGIDQARQRDEDALAKAMGRAPRQILMQPGGESLRQKADAMGPDPQTAHTADQVINGLTKFTGKAVAAMVAAGPIGGGALLGVEEANTEAQRLMEGDSKVDPATAWKVGATKGAISALGVMAPAGGATLAKTMGIAVAAGPASFAAQEGLSREILQRAGYPDEAKKHDPTDPLGLILSTIPGVVIGGFHMRGVAKRAENDARIKREGLSYAQESDLKKTAELSPTEQAASEAFERSEGNLKELRAAIKAEKNPENRAILEAELAKLTSRQQTEVRAAVVDRAAAEPEVVAAARVQVQEQVLREGIPDVPGARAAVMRAADEIAEGYMPNVQPVRTVDMPEFREWIAGSRAVDEAGEPVALVRVEDPAPVAGQGADAQQVVRYVEQRQDAPEVRQATDQVKPEPAFVSIKNPMVLREESAPVRVSQQEIAQAQAAGHDGIVIERKTGREFVPFAQEQIRPAVSEPMPQLATRPEQVSRGTDEAAPQQTGKQTSPEPGSKSEAASVDPQRLKALENEAPDLQVRLPGSDETISLADALQMAREQAKEEAKFADLVKVAAQCALTVG